VKPPLSTDARTVLDNLRPMTDVESAVHKQLLEACRQLDPVTAMMVLTNLLVQVAQGVGIPRELFLRSVTAIWDGAELIAKPEGKA
jgi:hypothetical protein